MDAVKNRTSPPLNRETVSSLNQRLAPPLRRENVLDLNHGKARTGTQAAPRTAPPAGARPSPAPRPAPVSRTAPPPPPPPTPAPGVPDMRLPTLANPLRKGQKTALGDVRNLRACFGWNVKDPRCDIDISAFLVRSDGKVPGDEWFVFYGQPQSPENSVAIREPGSLPDREVIQVALDKLNPAIQKVIFVLTIHEAFAQNLNFSMIKDAYLRLLDGDRELLSFRLEEYYANVTSMTLGELYLHNGQWKFNPVGNGVHQDLAGQCAIYGVEIC